ncbi:hypothetical protein PSEUDO8BK_60461 [Pseudomonas sp. 8BK]|nr:hypothetical protein PSEUDO8BK_60461 [Pseudomonas sp. 8BK]
MGCQQGIDWGILAGFSETSGPGSGCRARSYAVRLLIGLHWAAVHLNRLRVLNTMEINPILNSIKDLSERTQTIRGYL